MRSLCDCQSLVEVRYHSPDIVSTSLTEHLLGAWSEYAKCPESYFALKPKNLSFGQAASIPLAGMTALQAFRQYNGSLEGKTVPPFKMLES